MRRVRKLRRISTRLADKARDKYAADPAMSAHAGTVDESRALVFMPSLGIVVSSAEQPERWVSIFSWAVDRFARPLVSAPNVVSLFWRERLSWVPFAAANRTALAFARGQLPTLVAAIDPNEIYEDCRARLAKTGWSPSTCDHVDAVIYTQMRVLAALKRGEVGRLQLKALPRLMKQSTQFELLSTALALAVHEPNTVESPRVLASLARRGSEASNRFVKVLAANSLFGF